MFSLLQALVFRKSRFKSRFSRMLEYTSDWDSVSLNPNMGINLTRIAYNNIKWLEQENRENSVETTPSVKLSATSLRRFFWNHYLVVLNNDLKSETIPLISTKIAGWNTLATDEKKCDCHLGILESWIKCVSHEVKIYLSESPVVDSEFVSWISLLFSPDYMFKAMLVQICWE